MLPRLEIKQQTIEKKRVKTINQGIIVFIIAVLSLLTIVINDNIVKNPLIPNIYFILFMIGIFFGISGLGSLISPISNEDKAFLEILKTLEIVKSTFIVGELNKENEDILNIAYENITKAANYLKNNESFKAEATSWNLKNKDIEDRFIQNLQKIVAPAIKKNKFPPYGLEQIAFLFVDSDISKINEFNKTIEKSFIEIEPYEKISFSHKIINSKYGWLIKPSLISICLMIFILWGGSIVKDKTMIELFSQYYFELLAIGVAIFAIVLAPPYLSKRLSKDEK